MSNNLSSNECQICHGKFKLKDLTPANFVRNTVSEYIQKIHSTWNSISGFICNADLTRLRLDYVRSQLERDQGQLSILDKFVFENLQNQEILTQNTNPTNMEQRSFGEKLADHVAEFGGSWIFIIIFFIAMMSWIVLNSYGFHNLGFDPYPYILLNLLLSCLAAIQAPIIMMSQNRQESKDRMRAEHDYMVNLKAEVEIRNLTAKVDQLISHQWQTLMEIQQIQTEIMNEISNKVK